jgi:hypothetical protein
MSSIYNPWLNGIEKKSAESLGNSQNVDNIQTVLDGQNLTIVVKTESTPPNGGNKITVNGSEQRTNGFRNLVLVALVGAAIIGYVKRDDIIEIVQNRTDSGEDTVSDPKANNGENAERENLRFTPQSSGIETSLVESGCSPVLIQESESTFTDDISKELCWSTGEIIDGLQNGIPRSVGTISLTANNIYGPVSDSNLSSWFAEGEITGTELSAFVAYNVIAPIQDTVLYVLDKEGEPFLDSFGNELEAKVAGMQ